MSITVKKDETGFILNGILWIASEQQEDDSILAVPEEEAKRNSEEPLQLKEGCSYEYELLNPDHNLQTIPGIIHPSKRYKYRGRLTPGNYVGRLPLIIETGSEPLELAIEVRSSKSDYRTEYRKMLEEITAECTDLLMIHSSPVTQRFAVDYGNDSESLYQRFSFVQSMVDSDDFHNAVQRIITMPVTSWKYATVEMDCRRVKKITSNHIRQIAAGSNRMFLPDNHHLYNKIGSIPRNLSTSIKTNTLDNPENRFIKHALTEFARFSGFVCQKILDKQGKKLPNIYFEAKTLEGKLSEYLSHNVFKGISKVNTLSLNSPVLQRKEGYREIFRIWLMYDLAAKLTWDGLDNDTYHTGKRNVAALYEYWLFFKLLRLVEEIFQIEPAETKKLIQETNDGLGLQLKTGRHTAINGKYTHKNRELRIKYSYNRTFKYTDYPESGSWTQQMRPDYTLSFWPAVFSEEEAEKQELIVHIHFDAKYKVQDLEYLISFNRGEQDGNLYDELNEEKELEKSGTFKRADLLKMHAYKDAIRRTAGAYVIYPGSESKTHKGFHELIPGLGAFAVSPLNNEDGLENIKQFILNVLDHYTNRTTQREFYSFYKYRIMKDSPGKSLHERLPEYSILKSKKRERIKPAQEINILIGYIQDKQKKWIKENGLYNIRMDKEITPRFTGADYLLLYDRIEENRILHIWENGFYKIKKNPIIRSKKWLLDKNYPSPNMPEYFVYEISCEIEDWSAGKIDKVSLPEEIDKYRPFTKPLPELFLRKT